MSMTASEEVLLVPRERIGDSLIAMVVAQNFARAGFKVSVLNAALCDLAAWFPEVTWIDPRTTDLAQLDMPVVVHQNEGTLQATGVRGTRATHFLGGHSLFSAKRLRVDVYTEACRVLFGLTAAARENGLTSPLDIDPPVDAGSPPDAGRPLGQRIVIHPSSREPEKAWPRAKFAALAGQLAARGREVVVLLAPGEAPGPLGAFPCESFARLDDVARFLCASKAFIGNDSGIGHLASNLGLATTTLFVRDSIARRWRPSWSDSVAVLPRVQLPLTFIKYRTWKLFTPVDHVLHAFDELMARVD